MGVRVRGKNWALTDLGSGTSLELQIAFSPRDAAVEDVRIYAISQYTSGWAVNEIPAAQCMLAMGRDIADLQAAQIHSTARDLRQMRRAKVVFKPKGEYGPDGTRWPAEFTIFDGYFMGLAYNKVNGKVQVVANLKHWLIDLAGSSCLTANSHPLNPAHLTAPAVMLSLDTTGAAESHYVSQLPGIRLIRDDITTDLWGGIKKLFCGLTGFKTAIGSTAQEGNCGGTGRAVGNERARLALSKIEGPASIGRDTGCSKDYKYGVPLPLLLQNVHTAEDAVAAAITTASVDSYANTTFWDKLVGEYCPAFGLAVVPGVDFALVVADTPAYSGGVWSTVEPSEYDSFQMQADLERPLRAVGVTAQFGSFLGAAEAGNGSARPPAKPAIGGCFAANIDEPDDGVILYVSAPAWLQALADHELYAGGNSGLTDDRASRSDTTPAAAGGAVPPRTGEFAENVNELMNLYAHDVFVGQMLRGRSGIFGGKLRFDIGPGSIVRVKGSEARFLAGEDALATDVVGCVSRLTVAINAESGIAGTTFVLSHLRTAAENDDRTGRTSVDRNPLFRRAIHGGGLHGSPLVAGHELLGTEIT